MKGNVFQIVVVGIFGFLLVLGIIIFASSGNKSSSGVSKVTVWGILPQASVLDALSASTSQYENLEVIYEQKNLNTFDADLLEALASGNGPDLFLLPSQLMIRHKNKIVPIPYESLSVSEFTGRYVSGANMLLSPEGILGLPVTIDPLVLYYNETMLEGVGLSLPPTHWQQLISVFIPKLTQLGENNTVEQATIALGAYDNVTYAKDIVALLLLQLGSNLVEADTEGLTATLTRSEKNIDTSESLRFFTDFSNPLKDVYTWNQSLEASRDAFINETLAFYIGYASEYDDIIKRNPNLDFNVSFIPQLEENASHKVTYGVMNVLGISKATQNQKNAFTAATLFSNPETSKVIAESLGLPPVRRDLLFTRNVDTRYIPVFYDSAVFARSWRDPNPFETEILFEKMIEDVLSGRSSARQALNEGQDALQILLP
ncbi:MAG: ABC-type glycerol-3-phosphate transport system substrate-binding protein [Flavobacteriaceae bacterium]|jgi:ABC-type glycerol-3-phosphate transport system substrate-binding protein